MIKNKWLIIMVSVITLGIIVFGVYKIISSEEKIEDNVGSKDEKSIEEQREEFNEGKEDTDEDENRNEAEDISKKQVQKLENILGLSEETLASKEQIKEDVKTWVEEGVIQGEDDNYGITEAIRENYGEIVLESYLSSKLVTSDMDDYDINQMAIGFPMEDLEGRKIYYDLKPFEKVTSRLNGDVDREPEIVIGGENSQEDFEKYYYKDTKGFEDIKGNEVGYYSLVFYENTENTIKSFSDMGAELDEIDDLLGFNVVYYMKLDEEYTEEEIKDKISQVEINGNTGERMFELLSSQDEYIYPKDSLIKVNVPIDTKEVFGEKEELKVEIDWEEGKLKEPEIEIGRNKVKLDEHTEEEYLQGVTVEK